MNTSLVLIEGGIHDDGGNSVEINIPISSIGESREHCIVIGGLEIERRGYKAPSTSLEIYTAGLKADDISRLVGKFFGSGSLESTGVPKYFNKVF